MFAKDARRILVAYDIPHDKRRARLAELLISYGDRLQFSVFLMDARPADVVRLRAKIQTLIVPGEDSVAICDLGLSTTCEGTTLTYLGLTPELTNQESFIL